MVVSPNYKLRSNFFFIDGVLINHELLPLRVSKRKLSTVLTFE